MRSRPNRSRLRSGVPGRLVGVGDRVRTFPLPHSRASMASAPQARDRSLGGGQPRRVSREVSRPRGDLPHPLRDRLRRVRSSVRRCWSGDERRWLPARASNRRFRRASQHPRGISRGRSDVARRGLLRVDSISLRRWGAALEPDRRLLRGNVWLHDDRGERRDRLRRDQPLPGHLASVHAVARRYGHHRARDRRASPAAGRWTADDGVGVAWARRSPHSRSVSARRRKGSGCSTSP